MGWAKQQENHLRASKRCLNSDFKVGVTCARQIRQYLSMSLGPNQCLQWRSIWHLRSHAPSFPCEVKHPLPAANNLIEIPLNSIISIVFLFSWRYFPLNLCQFRGSTAWHSKADY